MSIEAGNGCEDLRVVRAKKLTFQKFLRPAAVGAGEGDAIEVGDRNPVAVCGVGWQRAFAERVNALGDAFVGDAAGLGEQGLGSGALEGELLSTWKLVLAGELFGVVWNAMEQYLASLQNPEAVDFDFLGGCTRNLWKRLGGAFGSTLAELDDRANGAQRIVFLAERGTEFHHRLIVGAWGILVQDFVRQGGEGFDRFAVVLEAALVGRQASQNAHDIAIDDGSGKILGN